MDTLNSTPLKPCPKCKNEFPPTPEYFHRNKTNLDGLSAECKTCRCEIVRKSKKAHAERVYESNRLYRLATPEKQSQYKKTYTSSHVGSVRSGNAVYRAAHKAERAAYNALYDTDHPENRRLIKQRRRAREISLPDTLTLDQWLMALDYFHRACVCCGSPNHIHADHWIPIAADNCPGTIAGNIVPLCQTCNTSKGDREAVDWLNWKFGSQVGERILRSVEGYFECLLSQS